MGLISPPQVNDNDAIVKGLWNDPNNIITNAINGNLDNDNIKPNAGIATSKLASDFGIVAGMLSASAIKLGYAEVTASQSTITTETDLTGLTATVTAPGTRDLLILLHIPDLTTTANGQRASLGIKESTTVLGRRYQWLASTSGGFGVDIWARVSAPSAGSHTYKAAMARDVGAGSVGIYAAGSGEQAYILVMAI